jgi:hypothetical protein
MKNRILWTLWIVLGLILSACSAAAPAATQAPSAGNSNEAYPAPAATQAPISVPQTYPAPSATVPEAAVTQAGAATSNETYPNIKSGDTISWEAVVTLLNGGQVTKIAMTPDLKLSVSDKNGRTLVSIANSADEVQKAIDSCGEKCKGVEFTKP